MDQLTPETAETALAPIVTMLQADGYQLAVQVQDNRLDLAVSPGPDACVECLVPKPVFVAVVRSTLEKAGYNVEPESIVLSYPPTE
jgi:hypothetical protein